MKYFTVSVEACHRLESKGFRGDHPEIRHALEPRGTGPELGRLLFEQDGRRMLDLTEDESRDPDQIEGKAAVFLYPTLAALDSAILEDPGFWRYLFLRCEDLNKFVRWRHEKSFERARTEDGYTGHRVYFDATKRRECVLTRMYLRVRSLGGDTHGDLAFAILQSTEFWWSHIIGVRTSQLPAIVRAFVRMQRDRRLKTDPLREFAKHLNGLRANVVLHDYDDDEADALINELRARLDGPN